MLVITRKVGQSIWIGNDVRITLIKTRSGDARIGIECPKHIVVDREEVRQEIEQLGFDRRDGREFNGSGRKPSNKG